ncbi:hypothetical protein A9Q86_12325 [Flavobacteriales bacterium 33_180_T64]|nr:hypothetical protein A9Q86_12325 [Flavobacteriales bacterium 33_180_T64]
MLPFSQAKKIPFYFFGRVKFSNLKGEVVIDAPIKKGMVGFGQKFERRSVSKGIAEMNIQGKIVFKGYAHIGKDCYIGVDKNAYCEIGDMSCFGSDVTLQSCDEIIMGKWTRIGYESQVFDTNAHQMMNTLTGEHYAKTGKIKLGNYNSISNRVSIMPNTKTPDYCVIASNSLCNKDYTYHGSNVLLGGIPLKLLKDNYSRDWDGEEERMIRHLIKKYLF